MNSHEYTPKQDDGSSVNYLANMAFFLRSDWDQNTDRRGINCSRKLWLQTRTLQCLGDLCELYTSVAESGCGREGILGNERPAEGFSVLTLRRQQKAEDVGRKASRWRSSREGASCLHWIVKVRMGLAFCLEAVFLHHPHSVTRMALLSRVLIFPLGLFIYRYSMK